MVFTDRDFKVFTDRDFKVFTDRDFKVFTDHGKAPSRQSQSSCGIRPPRKSPNSWDEDKVVLACEDAKRQWGSPAEPEIFSQIIICLFCMRIYCIYRPSCMWTPVVRRIASIGSIVINCELVQGQNSVHDFYRDELTLLNLILPCERG